MPSQGKHAARRKREALKFVCLCRRTHAARVPRAAIGSGTRYKHPCLLLLKGGLRPPPISLHVNSGSLHLKTQQPNPHIHYILFRVHYILIQAVQRAPYNV